jgi:ABC-type Fe3+-hydroxamate transport system substrate-binding protein
MRVPTALTSLLVGALLATGCGARPEPLASLPDSPVTIVDGTGASVTLPRPARTIASADAAATATLKALGASVTALAPGAAVPVGTELVIVSAATGAPSDGGAVPTFRWGVGDLRDAGLQVAQLGLAVGRGGKGVALARSLDASITALLARATGEPVTPVFIEGFPLQATARDDAATALLVRLGGRPVATPGATVSFAQLRRLAPEAWIAIDPAPTTLASVRRSAALRAVPAVRDGRVLHLVRVDLEPSPTLAATLAAIVHALHPAA